MRYVSVVLAGAALTLACDANDPSSPWQSWLAGDINHYKTGVGCAKFTARAFADYLSSSGWLPVAGSSFRQEWDWLLSQHPGFPPLSQWHETGNLGRIRIRQVDYTVGGVPLTTLILAERTPGSYVPLLVLAGSVRDARTPDNAIRIRQAGAVSVLVFMQDFGGNVPMVKTWAWVWSSPGPVLVRVEDAVHEAIEKIAPGYVGYDMPLDWEHLRGDAPIWKEGKYVRKIDVHESVSIQFRLDGSRLIPVRIDYEDVVSKVERHWP